MERKKRLISDEIKRFALNHVFRTENMRLCDFSVIYKNKRNPSD